MGRTNIVLDDALIRETMRLTGAKTKREAVDVAMRELVKRRKAYRKLLALGGKIHWEGDLDAWRRSRV